MLAASGLALLGSGCASLPPPEGRTLTAALTATDDTRLGRAIAPQVAAHPGLSGVNALVQGPDAFGARVRLAEGAERTLDAQYYIWHPDEAGLLLLEALWNASRRGVRVRILIDDQNTKAIEPVLAAIAGEPNIEVRLYNPFPHRDLRVLNVTDFSRLNRRMHNKSLIADNQAAIVGGRNIGNEYFGAGTEVPFKDLDVIAIGPAVREVSAQFDLYWNSPSAYPAPSFVGSTPDATRVLAGRFAQTQADPDSRAFLEAVRNTPFLTQLEAKTLSIEWSETRLVRDDPAKTLHPDRTDVLLLSQLMEGAQRPRASLDMISPYFVPGEKGTAFLEGLARDGVRVRVLTNSLGATDVGVVHTGYAKRRCQLARAGVQLFELKPLLHQDPRREKDRGGPGTSSAASLHAKTYAADRERIFVGSFNFDPRSALLNTEMGLVIHSPALAGRLAEAFDQFIPANAYEVRVRSDDSCIEWIERTPAGEVIHVTEPETGWLRRTWLGFLALLPLDWML